MMQRKEEFLTEEPIKLAPTVMESLSKSGKMDETMANFFRLVHQQKFPLNNIFSCSGLVMLNGFCHRVAIHAF
jgi:hypothetical protein